MTSEVLQAQCKKVDTSELLAAQGESRRQLGASVKGEWPGKTSAKFTTNRRNIAPPNPDEKPMGQRQHFEAKTGYQPDWKPGKNPSPERKNGMNLHSGACLTKDDARQESKRGGRQHFEA